MKKILRRYVWLISAFTKQYLSVMAISIFLALVFGLIAINLINKLPARKTTYRLGVVGVFNSNNLPPLVKTILGAGITRVGQNLTIVNNLAESLEVSSDEKTYTYKFKDGLKWNDGSNFKSSQVSLTIPSVKTSFPDSKSITFELPEKFSPVASLLVNPITDKSGHLISNFIISLSQNTNGNLSKIELVSYDLRLIIKPYPNTTQILTAYRLGEIDAVYGLISTTDLDLAKEGHLKTLQNLNQSLTLFFNTDDASLKDKAIRQALAYAIKDKTHGNQRSLGPISPTSWAYNPLVKTYDYDSTKAKKFLKDLSLELATQPQYLSLAESLKNDLAELGVNINIKVVTNRPSNFQLYLSIFESPIDPDQYTFWHSTQAQTNKSHLDNDKIDKLLEDGRRTSSIVERKRIYAEFQRTFSEEIPALFLLNS
jgi:peptide/nickel transport system substrate-binding protein